VGIDIRVPIGWLFLALGALLSVYGLVSDDAIYARSLGVNVNLGWGIVLLVFGATFLFFGRRARKRILV
jgi:hypothetical protein